MSCSCCEKTVVTTDKAPKALGPYSVAIKYGDLVFTSGQVGINPETGNIVDGGVEAETRQVLTNLKNVLAASGTELGQVVKTTVFLRDMADFAKMNAIYAEFFTENPPARSAVQVAALPKGAAVEIEAVAIVAEDEECDCGCNCK
ncbi:MAG: RidA family protein [Anaerolineaceae bacterium]|nr:RidA family protein [Anaerolineaceae bacterium]